MVLTTAGFAQSLLMYSSRIQLSDSSLSFPNWRQFFVVSSTFRCWLDSHSTIHSLSKPCFRQVQTHSRLPGAPSRFYSQPFIYSSAVFSNSSICRYLITGQTNQNSATEEHSSGAPQRARKTAMVAVWSRCLRLSVFYSGGSSAILWESRARQAIESLMSVCESWRVRSAQGSSWNCYSSFSSSL